MTNVVAAYGTAGEYLPRPPRMKEVSAIGVASQSSLSRWSKDNDAQRPVNMSARDFAFHTEHEHNPWWQIDFGDSLTVNFIHLENRKLSGQDRVRSLTVSYSVDGAIWHEIWNNRDRVAFHSLTLSLDEAPPMRFVRLSLSGKEYLHLASVKIFTKCEPRPGGVHQTGEGAIFLANRSDGFGQRLKTVINAITLADFYGTKFEIDWPERIGSSKFDHSVEAISETFTKNFIEKHFVFLSDEEAESLPRIDTREVAADIENYTWNRGGRIASTRGDLYRIIQTSDLHAYLRSGGRQKAYEKIEFQDSILEARQIAKSVTAPDKFSSIHLRAGDIIYGKFKYTNTFTTKIIPYQVAELMIKKLQDEGKDVLLFGQDAGLMGYFRDAYNVILASELKPELHFSPLQSVMYDITLMSRSTEIYAGVSGVPELAAIIGDVPLLSLNAVFSNQEIKHAILAPSKRLDADHRITDFQKNFSITWMLSRLETLLQDEQYIELCNVGITRDAENHILMFLRTYKAYKCGMYQLGEEGCEALAARLQDQSDHSVTGLLTQGSRLAPIRKAAEAGYYWARRFLQKALGEAP